MPEGYGKRFYQNTVQLVCIIGAVVLLLLGLVAPRIGNLFPETSEAKAASMVQTTTLGTLAHSASDPIRLTSGANVVFQGHDQEIGTFTIVIVGTDGVITQPIEITCGGTLTADGITQVRNWGDCYTLEVVEVIVHK